jgi:hypothetical protein
MDTFNIYINPQLPRAIRGFQYETDCHILIKLPLNMNDEACTWLCRTYVIKIRPGCVGQTHQYRADTVPLTPAGELRLSASSSNPDLRQTTPTIPDSIPTSADHDICIYLGHPSINLTRQSSQPGHDVAGSHQPVRIPSSYLDPSGS